MREAQVFVQANDALLAVVDQIRDDQWSMAMPPDFPGNSTDTAMTLREVVHDVAYDDVWVPDLLAGRTMAEVGDQAISGDLLGDDPKAAFASIVERSRAAAEALDDPERTVHCSFGDYTAREYLCQITSFRGLRAYDVAKVLGVSTELPPALVEGMWEELLPRVDEWRSYGVFPDPVPVPDDAPLQHRLLGLTGRRPGA